MTEAPRRNEALDDARALLEKERHGVLSTLHARHDGWPFGSVTPYAVLPSGDPVVQLSEIAEHTKNLARDARAGLFVQDSAAHESPQEGARLALLVRAERLEGDAEAEAAQTYYGRFPAARGNLRAHGFFLFALRVERVRWIAGFGRMGWFERDVWIDLPKEDPLAPHAAGIVAHMNADHADALRTLARHHGAPPDAAVRLAAIDSKGLTLEVAGAAGSAPTPLRLAFPAPAPFPEAARKAVVALLAEARRGAT